MKQKRIIKHILDLIMAILLPVLMAEILIGQKAHEWLGVAIIVCFLVHHILNLAWIKNLFKGDYTPIRCLMTSINILLFADILSLAVSGIMMSGFVFLWLNIHGGMILARQLHLFASHWGLILMSAHLGLHYGIMLKSFRKMFHIEKDSAVRTWILRILAICTAAYGVYAFVAQKIYNYLFLKKHFIIFDETKPAAVFILETVAIIVLFAVVSYYLQKALLKVKCDNAVKKTSKMVAFALPILIALTVVISMNANNPSAPLWGGDQPQITETSAPTESDTENTISTTPTDTSDFVINPDGFVLVKGGTFVMGSPDDEAWRVNDEIQHTVTVSDFYISPYEVTQREYSEVMGTNPSNFSGDNLPVESVTWIEAVAFCNAKSEKDGLTPVYTIDGDTVTWDRSANGYRLPTEAEWEYACRAGTTTPFNTENSPGADVCNFYGHYPYQIEENYFSQGNLETKPGEYRQITVAVDSFLPNRWGIYNMHGNVSEWVWDLYGAYGTDEQTDPTGATVGNLRVYRGGGWNDFAKNMRSAYRATLAQDKGSFNKGIRLVCNAATGSGVISGAVHTQNTESGGKMLIASFHGAEIPAA